MENVNKDWRNIMVNMASGDEPKPEPETPDGDNGGQVAKPEDNLEGLEVEGDESSPEDVSEKETLQELEEEVATLEETAEAQESNTEEVETTDDDGIIDDWASEDGQGDSDDATPAFDPVPLAKELGIELEDGAKVEEFTKAVSDKLSSYEQELSEIRGNQIPENIPQALKDAIKVAAEGGNYEAYINVASVDYDAYSNEDLVANSVASHFTDESGNVDSEALEDYMMSLSETQVKIEGSKIREALKNQAETQKMSIQQEAERRRGEVVSKIDTALKDLDEIAGFKIQPHQKDVVRKAVKEDKIISDMFYTNGKFDGSKAVRAYLVDKYFDRMISYLRTSTKNATKKEILEEVTNADITTRSTPPSPKVEEKSALSSWIEKMKNN